MGRGNLSLKGRVGAGDVAAADSVGRGKKDNHGDGGNLSKKGRGREAGTAQFGGKECDRVTVTPAKNVFKGYHAVGDLEGHNLGEDHVNLSDFLDKAQRTKYEVAPSDHCWRLVENGDWEKALRPKVEKIFGFRELRGDCTRSRVLWTSHSMVPKGWKEWVTYALGKKGVKDRLERAGIYRAICLSTQLQVDKDYKGLLDLCSRWSPNTHTFVAAWGELSVSLEDIAVLYELPICGTHSPYEIKLSKNDKILVDGLKTAVTRLTTSAAKRMHFAGWIRQFYGEYIFDGEKSNLVKKHGKVKSHWEYGPGRDSDHNLEALIAMWLSRHLFEDTPREKIHEALFPMAVKMAQGCRFPLAVMFLGTLYARLDELSSAMCVSNGHFGVESYMNVAFLQMWAWEHLVRYAPEPRRFGAFLQVGESDIDGRDVKKRIGAKHCRAWQWCGVKRLLDVPLLEVLDNMRFIDFRPYNNPPRGVMQGKWSEMEMMYMLFIAPSAVVSFFKKRFHSLGFYPDRFAMQIGFDQGVPLGPQPLASAKECLDAFVKRADGFGVQVGETAVPLLSDNRHSYVHPNTRRWWGKVADDVHTFLKEPCRPIGCITNAELQYWPMLKFKKGEPKSRVKDKDVSGKKRKKPEHRSGMSLNFTTGGENLLTMASTGVQALRPCDCKDSDDDDEYDVGFGVARPRGINNSLQRQRICGKMVQSSIENDRSERDIMQVPEQDSDAVKKSLGEDADSESDGDMDKKGGCVGLTSRKRAVQTSGDLQDPAKSLPRIFRDSVLPGAETEGIFGCELEQGRFETSNVGTKRITKQMGHIDTTTNITSENINGRDGQCRESNRPASVVEDIQSPIMSTPTPQVDRFISVGGVQISLNRADLYLRLIKKFGEFVPKPCEKPSIVGNIIPPLLNELLCDIEILLAATPSSINEESFTGWETRAQIYELAGLKVGWFRDSFAQMRSEFEARERLCVNELEVQLAAKLGEIDELVSRKAHLEDERRHLELRMEKACREKEHFLFSLFG